MNIEREIADALNDALTSKDAARIMRAATRVVGYVDASAYADESLATITAHVIARHRPAMHIALEGARVSSRKARAALWTRLVRAIDDDACDIPENDYCSRD